MKKNNAAAPLNAMFNAGFRALLLSLYFATLTSATAKAQSVRPVAEKAWRFVEDHITPEGQIRRAYTAWAVPAKKGVLAMDTVQMPWIPGFILSTAYEMSTSQRA